MTSPNVRPTFENAGLQREIMQLRSVDNLTNLVYLAGDYLTLIAVMGAAVVFAQDRGSWGLAWWWNIPVFTLAVVLIGGVQHRLAGLGHEASHYSFMRNRFLNDFVPDVLCMFPLMTTPLCRPPAVAAAIPFGPRLMSPSPGCRYPSQTMIYRIRINSVSK